MADVDSIIAEQQSFALGANNTATSNLANGAGYLADLAAEINLDDGAFEFDPDKRIRNYGSILQNIDGLYTNRVVDVPQFEADTDALVFEDPKEGDLTFDVDDLIERYQGVVDDIGEPDSSVALVPKDVPSENRSTYEDDVEWAEGNYDTITKSTPDITDVSLPGEYNVDPISIDLDNELSSKIRDLLNESGNLSTDSFLEGLFNIIAPSYYSDDPMSEIKQLFDDIDLGELKDDLDGLIADIDSVEKPVLDYGNAPEISEIAPIDTSKASELIDSALLENLPMDFELTDLPDNITELYRESYKSILPEMQAHLSAQVDEWLNKYAPGITSSLAKLQAKLDAIIDGEKALGEDYEDALYRRARDKITQEANRNRDAARNTFSKRGFALPSQSLIAAEREITKDMADRLAMSATEAAIEKHKIEVDFLKFAIQTQSGIVNSLYTFAMQWASNTVSINGQALTFAKENVSTMIDVYKLELDKAQFYITWVELEIKYLEAKIMQAKAAIELVRLEFEEAKLSVELDSLEVDLYTKRIAAEGAKIDNYNSLIKGIEVKADIHKARTAAMGEVVKGYMAEMQMKEAEYDVYKAALSGDSEKLKARMSEIDVLEQRVKLLGLSSNQIGQVIDLYKAYVAIEGDKQDLAIRGADLGIKANEVSISAFRAELDRAKLEIEAAAQQEGADLKKASLILDQDKLVDSKLNSEREFIVSQSRQLMDFYKLKLDALKAKTVGGDFELRELESDRQAEQIRSQSAIEALKTNLAAFKAESDDITNQYEKGLGQLKINLEAALAEFKGDVQKKIAELENKQAQMGHVATLYSKGVDAWAQLAASTMSSLNTNVAFVESATQD